LTGDATELRARIAANLAGFTRITADPPDAKRAAVAIVLAPLEGATGFLLTRRSYALRRGAGQYALPGGHVEPGESALDAALRELHEELGVELPASSALGALDDFVTRGGHVVTPIVLWAETRPVLIPCPTEVHAAWLVPLAQLDQAQSPRWLPGEAGGPTILQMRINDHWINPPTAALIYQFREVALHGRPTRVAGIGQPAWTAR
jgi:8-oxo-dGTP pyrophosphatase MutT (NUDIX family)